MRISARTIALLGASALAIANLGRIPAGALAGRNAPITLADLAAALVWVALLVGWLTRRVRIVVDGVLSAALVFLGVAALSSALAIHRYGFSFEIVAYLARWMLYFGWYPFVLWCLTNEESRDASRQVDVALMVICGFGLFQSAFIPEFATRLPRVGDAPVWEYQGRRLVSTLLDPNFAGGMAMLALVPRLARVAEGLRERAWMLIVPAAAIVLTASRSSVLALAVALGVIVLARGVRRPLVKTLLVGAALTLPLLPAVISFGESMNKFSIDASAAQRLVTWKRAFTLFMEHPVLGIGFNATRQAQMAKGWTFIGGGDTAFDGGLLFVMVMTGIVGVALYIILLGRPVLAARRIWNDPTLDPEDRAHATGTAAATVAIVVHSLFTNTILLPFVMQVLWVRYGRLAHISAIRRRHLGLVAAAPLVAVAISSCSPCAGFESCTTEHRVRVSGFIVSHETGAPVSGAAISVTFAGTAAQETHVTSTDDSGRWEASGTANCCDQFTASVVVDPPGLDPYLVPAFAIPTLTASGDATLLGDWTERPVTVFAGTLVFQEVQPMPGATIRFEPVGGVPITEGTLATTADASGTFVLTLFSDRLGAANGTLVVNHPLLQSEVRMEGFSIQVGNRYGLSAPIGVPVWDEPVIE